MEWSDDYNVDIKEIDDQHKNLFEMVGRIEPLIKRGIYQGPEIETVINFLKLFTVTHFQFEEMCMKVRKCPLAKKNIDAHKQLLDFVNRFEEDYRVTGGSMKNLELLHSVLGKWLVQHICKIDQSMKN